MEYSPSGRYFICVGGYEAIIYEIDTGKILLNIIHDNKINMGIFSPCEKYIITCSDDKQAWINEFE